MGKGTGETQFHTTDETQGRKWADEGFDQPVFDFNKGFMSGSEYNELPGVRIPHTVEPTATHTVFSLQLPDGQE